MSLKNLTVNELECMAYDEIAELILEETGKKQKLITLFKKICDVLKLDYDKEEDKISDFFELLSTNKKFVMLKNGYWDLQINHKTKIVVEDSDDDSIELEEASEIEDEITEDNEEDIFYESEETDDVVDDDLADLVVVDDEEEAQE